MRQMRLIVAIYIITTFYNTAEAENVSCNYATSGDSATSCSVLEEKYIGVSRMHMGPELQDNSSYVNVDVWDNQGGYKRGPFFGTGYPVCVGKIRPVCSQWNMTMYNPTLEIMLRYGCSGSNCRSPVSSTFMLYNNGGNTPVEVQGGILPIYSYSRTWSSQYGNCIETGRIQPDVGYSFVVSGTTVDFTCSINIPAGQFFLSKYSTSINPVTPSSGGAQWSYVDLGIADVPDEWPGEPFRYNYIITYPQAVCDGPAVASYVFDENKQSEYTLHSAYQTDSVTVKLVPKQSIDTCTHNVYSTPGIDANLKIKAKLSVKSESANCDVPLTSNTEVLTDAETAINWTLSGLSQLAGGTEVKCTHNLVTELTWY